METTTARTGGTPTPGVYPGTAMRAYHAWEAASNSRLTRLMRSPAHMKAYIEGPPAETEALRLGRAIHTAVLEPDHFGERYVTADQCMAITKEKKRCTNGGVWMHRDLGWVCGVHAKGHDDGVVTAPAVEVLSADDQTLCLKIRDAVYRKDSARGLLTGAGEVELSMLWKDHATDVPCKARWDRHSPEIAGGSIVDLKTTKDASPRAFEKSIFDLGYHRQAGMYLMGARARKLPARHYTFVAVEKEPPFAVAVYRLSDGVVDAVRPQVETLLRRYAGCMESGRFPDYPDEVRDIFVPDWAWKVMDAQTEEIEEAA